MTGEFKPRNTARAKALRSQATPAERSLWTALSNRKVDGYKFSRQMPVGPYFADFLCRDAKLVVELDGFSHDINHEYDQRRDAFMVEQRFTVRRFANADVMNNLDGVVRTIALVLAEIVPPPAPPASGRGVEMTRPLC
jgi:very-short-patch-repair endonuclease